MNRKKKMSKRKFAEAIKNPLQWPPFTGTHEEYNELTKGISKDFKQVTIQNWVVPTK